MRLNFEVYIPFSKVDEEPDSFTTELTNELIELSDKVKIPLDDFGFAMVKIQKIGQDKIEKLKKAYPTYFKHEFLDLLHFEIEIDFESIFEFSDSGMPSEISQNDLNRALLTSITESRFTNFIIFTQLALPGSLNTEKGLMLKDGKYYHDFKGLSSSLVGIAYDKNSTWPHTQRLSILKVWEYIIDKTKILTDKSNTNIENGLNAFTYLFDYSTNTMHNLFWAMSGIEALYAHGDLGIGYQIDKKAKLFLGEPNEFKKVLTKLYNFRSKFIHGSMSIPINNSWLSNDDQDQYDNEFYEMECTANRLLTATLQKIIDKDLKIFEFEFKLKQ